MNKKKREELIAACFDGERPKSELDALLKNHPDDESYLASLGMVRDQIHAAPVEHGIDDPQFSTFMRGIEQGMDKSPSPWRGRLIWASMTAATLILALSIFSIVTPPPAPVDATEVDFVKTELSGATTEWTESEDVVTLWVNTSKEDI